MRFAVDMVQEGLISKEEALSAGRIPPDDLNQLLQPLFDPSAKRQAVQEGRLLAKGINAGPGAATGRIKFHADDAEAWVHKHGRGNLDGRVILVRRETSPEDIRGMQAADGILTAFGGASSHAALVSRQMGKVCVVGCGDLNIDYAKATMSVAGENAGRRPAASAGLTSSPRARGRGGAVKTRRGSRARGPSSDTR